MSLHGKLRGIVLLTTAIALGMAFLTTLAFNTSFFHRNLVNQVSILTQVVAITTAPSVASGDSDTAKQLLAALQAQSDVDVGYIFIDKDIIFASYHRAGLVLDASSIKQDPWLHTASSGSERLQYREQSGQIDLLAPIALDHKIVGRLYLRAHFGQVYTNVAQSILVALVVMVATVFLALFLTGRLQERISGPILRLALVMRRVSEEQDYSLRVEAGDADEVGYLINGFNQMLAQVEDRDKHLARYRLYLREEMAAHAAQLSYATSDHKPERSTEEISRATEETPGSPGQEAEVIALPAFHPPCSEGASLILVADDDPGVRLLVRHVLTQAGFRVLEVEDGHSVLAAFSAHHPALVILDVLMPGLDGFQTCTRLRQLSNGAHVPVLMMTGINDLVAVERAYQAGATDFLPNKHDYWTLLEHRVRYLLRGGQMLRALQHSESQLRILSLAIEQSPTSILITDSKGDIAYINPRFCDMTGYERHEVLGKNVRIIKHPDTPHVVHRDLWETITSGGIWRGELCNQQKNGLPYWVSLTISPIYGVGDYFEDQTEQTSSGIGSRITHYLSFQEDVTTRRSQELRIRYLSFFDTVTSLPNRRLLRDRLGQLLPQIGHPETLVALFFLDLDHFKRVNDTFGHRVGDQLLREVTVRLSEHLNKTNHVARLDEESIHAIARIGGDEFAFILVGMIHTDRMAQIAQQILDQLARPFLLEETDVVCSASIGIAVYPVDGSDIDTLLQSADTAMYSAKSSGRNTYQFYSHAMNESGVRRMRLESNLRRALEREELVLHYQPQMCFCDDKGRIIGFEALVRWNCAEMGMISPAEFIPIAEESNLIVPIGTWVLNTACRAAAAWQAYGNLRVAVNLSAQQLSHQELLGTVTRALVDANLHPDCLELEITESVIMRDAPATALLLAELKSIGLHLAIDDFGTGYSSLSYLKTFSIDTLKVDRSFVMDIETSSGSAHIVTAIIAMGHGLGLKIVAEGVEDIHQLDFLHTRGCDLIQGYLVSRPLPESEIKDFLERFDRAH